MKFLHCALALIALSELATSTSVRGVQNNERKLKKAKKAKVSKAKKSKNMKEPMEDIELDMSEPALQCPKTGIPLSIGYDTSERLLLREGLIDEIPSSLCGSEKTQKNVILIVGDGMGWEMVSRTYFVFLSYG